MDLTPPDLVTLPQDVPHDPPDPPDLVTIPNLPDHLTQIHNPGPLPLPDAMEVEEEQVEEVDNPDLRARLHAQVSGGEISFEEYEEWIMYTYPTFPGLTAQYSLPAAVIITPQFLSAVEFDRQRLIRIYNNKMELERLRAEQDFLTRNDFDPRFITSPPDDWKILRREDISRKRPRVQPFVHERRSSGRTEPRDYSDRASLVLRLRQPKTRMPKAPKAPRAPKAPKTKEPRPSPRVRRSPPHRLRPSIWLYTMLTSMTQLCEWISEMESVEWNLPPPPEGKGHTDTDKRQIDNDNDTPFDRLLNNPPNDQNAPEVDKPLESWMTSEAVPDVLSFRSETLRTANWQLLLQILASKVYDLRTNVHFQTKNGVARFQNVYPTSGSITRYVVRICNRDIVRVADPLLAAIVFAAVLLDERIIETPEPVVPDPDLDPLAPDHSIPLPEEPVEPLPVEPPVEPLPVEPPVEPLPVEPPVESLVESPPVEPSVGSLPESPVEPTVELPVPPARMTPVPARMTQPPARMTPVPARMMQPPVARMSHTEPVVRMPQPMSINTLEFM
jgi:hypothetical protein